MEKVNLSAPWVGFYREVNEMFKMDPDVVVKFNDEEMKLTLSVGKYEKAEALKKILPKEKVFGNVKVEIVVDYVYEEQSIEDTYKAAFDGNPAFEYTFVHQTSANPITFVVFEKYVVQYWNDDLSDPHGVTSTLYKNIAEDIFEKGNGVIYSTDSDPDILRQHVYQATPVEIEEWEKYNGKGSFSNGSSIVSDKEPIQVKDKKTFKAVFSRKNKNEYPF